MYEFYVTITGAKQGVFKGEAAGRQDGKLVGLAYEQASSAPATGAGGSAKPAFGPVRFTKQWGASSPQLLQALATGEVLTEVRFEFIRSSDEGVETVFQRIRLSGARVIGLRPFIDLDAEPSSLMPLPPLEEVEISFKAMEVENLVGNTLAVVGATPKGKKTPVPGKTGKKTPPPARGGRARR
jgi:type VI secretion system secreted protein Hcp